jgi:hypothetical protein
MMVTLLSVRCFDASADSFSVRVQTAGGIPEQRSSWGGGSVAVLAFHFIIAHSRRQRVMFFTKYALLCPPQTAPDCRKTDTVFKLNHTT